METITIPKDEYFNLKRVNSEIENIKENYVSKDEFYKLKDILQKNPKEINPEFLHEILSMKEKDFLTEKESERFYEDILKEAKND